MASLFLRVLQKLILHFSVRIPGEDLAILGLGQLILRGPNLTFVAIWKLSDVETSLGPGDAERIRERDVCRAYESET